METELKLKKTGLEQFNEARKNYILALAIDETNKQIDNDSKQEILNENVFLFGRESICQEVGQRITKQELSYNLSDEDFKQFSILVDERRKEKGLKLNYNKFEWAIKEPWNLSSDAESRTIREEAEKVFVKAIMDILPDELSEDIKPIIKKPWREEYKKLLDISLNLDTVGGL